MTRPCSSKKQSNLPQSNFSFNVADLLEKGHAQVSEALPGDVKLPNKKRVAEPTVALQSKKLKDDSLVETLHEINGIMSECGVDPTEEQTRMLPKLPERRRSLEQDERGGLFLEKKPLRDKVAKLANDLGVPAVSEDAEHCLSLSIEEFFRRILNRLVKVSDQGQDMAKRDQNVVVTSDVGVQIRMMKQNAREALKAKEMARQKQAGNVNDEKKTSKKNKKAKEETIKVTPRQTAATDEMLLKWEIMAEQAQLKRKSEGLVSSQKESGSVGLQQKQELAGISSLAASGIPQGVEPKRAITVKDLIAVLEMDPHMAKSTLLYHFFERFRTKCHLQ